MNSNKFSPKNQPHFLKISKLCSLNSESNKKRRESRDHKSNFHQEIVFIESQIHQEIAISDLRRQRCLGREEPLVALGVAAGFDSQLTAHPWWTFEFFWGVSRVLR